MSDTLSNLQAVVRGIAFLVEMPRRNRGFIQQARDEMWLNRHKTKELARKQRLQRIFEARNGLKLTYREIGAMIGVSQGRARQLYNHAQTLARRGWLYSSRKLKLETTIE